MNFITMKKIYVYTRNVDGEIYSDKIDEHGNPVERTKSEYPDSYDGFITWRGGKNEEANNTIYSDRLLQWDYKRCRDLMQKHFGKQSDYWSEYSSELIEEFLREWCNAPKLKLIFIMEYCNVSNGYPCWRFDFNSNK